MRKGQSGTWFCACQVSDGDLKWKWECQVQSCCVNSEFRGTVWTRDVYQESATHGGYLKPRDGRGPLSKKNTEKRC